MRKLPMLAAMLLSAPVFALPSASELSTEELVGQTMMPRVVIGHHQAFKKPIKRGEVTGFFVKAHEGIVTFPEITLENQDKFNKKQRKMLVKTLKDLKKWAAKSPHKIPLFLGFDYEGGTVTSPMYMGLKQMPSNMLLAATQDKELVTQMYAQQAAEIKRVGGNMALGPVTDVNSNPANPIIQTRSFGDQAKKVGPFSAAAVKGLQQSGIPAVVKHFPGHGDTATDSHFSQPVTNLPEKELWNTHISAFQFPIDAGVHGVMNNHVVYPQIDNQNSSIFSHKITHDILRDRMGFKGLIMTDGLDMDGAKGKTMQELVLDGFAAGNDVLLLTGLPTQLKESAIYPKWAAQWVKEDLASANPKVSREALQQSVQSILDLKGTLVTAPDANDDEANFARVSRKVAEAGVTLVRDEQNIIPAFQQAEKICVVMFADGIFSKQTYALADTLRDNDKQVSYVQNPRKPTVIAQKQIQACTAGADVIVVGTSSTSSINPNQNQLVNNLLDQAEQNGQKVALVSLLNPYEIPAYSKAKTVLALYGPTMDTTAVAAEILLGKLPAKGVLPVQLPKENKLPFENTPRLNFL